jgi:DNA-binding FadR family transcriptional regulator
MRFYDEFFNMSGNHIFSSLLSGALWLLYLRRWQKTNLEAKQLSLSVDEYKQFIIAENVSWSK